MPWWRLEIVPRMKTFPIFFCRCCSYFCGHCLAMMMPTRFGGRALSNIIVRPPDYQLHLTTTTIIETRNPIEKFDSRLKGRRMSSFGKLLYREIGFVTGTTTTVINRISYLANGHFPDQSTNECSG